MITFFIILALLMVLVAAAGQWQWGGSRRRVVVDRDVVVDRRPDLIEEIVDEPYPVARTRRVVRRRRY